MDVKSTPPLLVLSIALGMCAASCASSSAAAPPIAIVDCTLIDGTGAAPVADAVVLVRDGRIAAAGPRASVPIGAGYATVSLHGAYLLPGFINAHVHSYYDAGTLRKWLAAGVTSVRDAGYTASSTYIKERDALNRDPANARLISATPMITHAGGYGAVGVNGAEEARAAVKRYLGLGAELVKIAIEDDLQGRTWPLMSAEEVKAAAAAGHAAGKKVAAHISHVRNLSLAIEGGVDDLNHMVVEPLPEDLARKIAAKGIAWVPTLELWKGVSEKHGLVWDDIAVENTGIFFRAGGKIALGTDFNGYTIPFDDGFPITEARLLLEAGLTPMDVIVAGTRNSAVVSGRPDLGTVEPGKIADLLAVKRNPLEDISALQETVQVFKAGRPVLAEGSEGSRVQARGLSGVPDDLAASFDPLIAGMMKEKNVPGLAVAVTNESGTIWSKGFGWTDRGRSAPVTPDTLFAAIGISTAFTAAGVMEARQEGLVDLSTPISAYLPDLRLRSIFQERPENLITLRNLLTHTAGLPEEAPYGNNYNLGESDFRAHVLSISRAWLRFPVGSAWAYSNLGPDLAGWVLEARSGVPFEEYMESRLFAPLGMRRTFASAAAIPAGAVRARGCAAFQDRIPDTIPMAPSMGAFTTAADAARFLRLMLGSGQADGARILTPTSTAEMLSIPPGSIAGAGCLGSFKHILTLPAHSPTAGYGSDTQGFGYTAVMALYPRLGIGIVLLANSADAAGSDVMYKVVNAIVDDPRTIYHDRLSALPSNDQETVIPRAVMPGGAAYPSPAAASDSGTLAAWAGDYRQRQWGRPTGEVVGIRAAGGSLTLNGQELRQAAPGLFFSPDGNALDFTVQPAAWRGIALIRISVPAWQWVLFGAALLALPALLLPAVGLAIPRRSRTPLAPRALTPAALSAAGVNAALCALLAFALTRYTFLIGEGMPPLTPGTPTAQAVLIASPLTIAGLTCLMIAGAALSWRRRFWSPALRIFYTIMTGGAVVFVAVMAIWRLL